MTKTTCSISEPRLTKLVSSGYNGSPRSIVLNLTTCSVSNVQVNELKQGSMESEYWHLQQKENWNVLPFRGSLPETGTLSTEAGEQFPDTATTELAILQPRLFSDEDQFLSDFKYVMKKTAMIVVGITLFVAGYRHTHRQNEYITAQAALSNSTAAMPQSGIPDDIKQTAAFRLVQPF
ncbi:hypothetical protein [Spirosoma agri]|uniref:Uncharacterized protein n=1 Tax=Spirosoma agri TaxID=1987381 RepID=A0A6M0IB08_9BACT|nr:hypothetical protein [Spirosoma agri]NEU65279.1 hypothetical protein [Spirosoma agri]